MVHHFRFPVLVALAVALIAVGIVSSGSAVSPAGASGPAENAGIPPGFSKVTFIDFPGGRSDVIVEHGPNGGGGPPGQDVGSVCTSGAGTDQCDTNSFDGKKWFELPVLYNVNLRNSGDDGHFLSTIQASAQTWEDDPNSAFDAAFNGTTGRKSSSLKNRMDGNNDITWESLNRYQNPIAVAIFWSFTSTGEIVEFDVTNNVNFAWSSNGGPNNTEITDPDSQSGDLTKFDLQNIETHELGHAFAGLMDLTHPSENKLTMYGFGTQGELLKRTLGLGDQWAIRTAFPQPVIGPTGSIAGTVSDSSDGSAIAGAIVSTDTGESTTTDATGSYTLSGVPTGDDRTVTASASGYDSASQMVTVTDGGTAPADFALAPVTSPTTLSVTVTTDKASYVNRENAQITVAVTDGANPVSGAGVHVEVTTPSGKKLAGDGTTDASGEAKFRIRVNTKRDGCGEYTVDATASKEGLSSGSGSTNFQVPC